METGELTSRGFLSPGFSSIRFLEFLEHTFKIMFSKICLV